MVWNITVGRYCSSFCNLLFSITFSFKILSKIFVKFLFWNNHRFTRSCKNSMIPYTLHPVSVKWMLLITVHQNQEISTCVYRSMHLITHVESYNHDHNQDTDLESIWDLASSRHQFHSNSYKKLKKKDTDLFHYHKDLPLATPLQSYAHLPSPASQALNLGNHCKIFMAIPYFCSNSLLITWCR